ncbi:hypothetical protein [Chryseobacterium vrystaatense]|uniref:Uncharacterized protein n=1 Tax=Chryseobacterium vrystaatense TaxID=307480 RepID=A0A1M4ZKC8_9FLAO|nr:hypothetical protein [Chryseobacterium vrystaatense]SHF18499.1 hypothetical protein SAMN02787073_1625 [Chryseobacterium vrystaatense]
MNYVTQSNGEAAQLRKEVTQVVTNDISLTGNDSGKILLVGTDAKTITLPTTQSGLVYTFVNIGAAGNNIIKVSPAATDGISGTVTLASTVVVLDGVVNKAALNTKASAQTGDSLTIVGTGLPGTKAWIVLSATGIWARQA